MAIVRVATRTTHMVILRLVPTVVKAVFISCRLYMSAENFLKLQLPSVSLALCLISIAYLLK